MTGPSEFKPTEQDRSLLRDARALAQRSIGPAGQSGGAIALTDDGTHFSGVSFHFEQAGGVSVCAEQVAMSAARAGSSSAISTVVLWVPATAQHHPCGPCRQIWLELAPRARFLLQQGDQAPVLLLLDDLLPDAFDSFEPAPGGSDH